MGTRDPASRGTPYLFGFSLEGEGLIGFWGDVGVLYWGKVG